jgi:hypothetical protein
MIMIITTIILLFVLVCKSSGKLSEEELIQAIEVALNANAGGGGDAPPSPDRPGSPAKDEGAW